MRSLLKFLLLITPLMATQPVKSNLSILNDTSNEDTPYKKKPKTALELEDEKFLSIRRRNIDDRVLPAYTLELAQKHIDSQEYILAQYYVKVYLRDYSDYGNLDKAWFLGIESLFLKLKLSESQKDGLDEILKLCDSFAYEFPKSTYIKEVKNIQNQSILIEYDRNNNIANYYEKIGKTKAAAFYRAKNAPYTQKVSKIPRPPKVKKSNLDLLSDDSFE